MNKQKTREARCSGLSGFYEDMTINRQHKHRNQQGRPNVLVLMTDQQRWDSLGVYGCDFAHTPNLDRLGREGAVFDNCYINNPICTPSRASMLTGKHLPGHGVYRLYDVLPETEKLFTCHLQDLGYTTALFGKLHVSAKDYEHYERHPHDGFDVFEPCMEGCLRMDSPNQAYAQWLRENHPEFHDRLAGNLRNELHHPRSVHMTHWAAERTIDFLKRQDGEQPFFCMMSIFDPHDPYEDYPLEMESLVDRACIPDPVVDEQPLSGKPSAVRREHHGSYMGDFANYSLDDLRAMRYGYHASLAFADQEFGRVLDVLEAQGLADNTLVIFTSDHGDMLGDHGLLVKGAFFYEANVRVPLLIRPPRNQGMPSRRVDGLVQLHDLAATVLAAAGMDHDEIARLMPKSRDLLPLCSTTDQAGHDFAICCYRNSGLSSEPSRTPYFDPPIHGTMIRDARYKLNLFHEPYDHSGAGEGELYDMAGDPGEQHDLWHDPKYAEIKDVLLRKLLEWLICNETRPGSRGGEALTNPVKPAAEDGSTLIVEATRFDDPGGWTIDTSCMESTQTPFLMAHGLGTPVADATTAVRLPTAGRWRVWVRTYDWVARWGAPGTPGRFAVLVAGRPLAPEFGVTGETWGWQDGGVVEIDDSVVQVTLRDLTGFNGRCQAVCFSRDTENVPPPDDACLWRRPGMDSSAELEQPRRYDLVVVGGGYAGMCAALMAARSGLAVALVQDRDVLGGNASSEIRVPLRGLPLAGGRLPWLGCCVAELQYDAAPNARQPDEHSDARHLAVMKAERGIELLLGHVLYDVTTEAGCIRTIRVRDLRHGRDRIIAGRCFADCTGHGTLGALAGAEYVIGMGGDPAMDHDHPLMGMTNTWSWEMTDTPVPAPEMPWALDMTLEDIPSTHLRSETKWGWESGFHRHPIRDLERIRDNNLRAIFGAWRAMKRRAEYVNARLTRVAAIGGTRESRRLIGDLVLNEDDMLARVDFPDGFVPVSWFLDRHIPTPESRRIAPDDPFLSMAIHKPGTERNARPRHEAPWYGIPYRCLYSRNIGNLFMAGRNISTSYWALGATRVMRTCGMMGEVVGRAAAICVRKDCAPRDVFARHLEELRAALK